MPKTAGQVAFDKWRELVYIGVRGLPWHELPKTAREGWEEIAAAVLDHHHETSSGD